MTLPQASVIVPVYNGTSSLSRLLDALAAQRCDIDWELIVVDNASSDGTADLARGHSAVTTVVFEGRRGSYAARNRGIQASRGALLGFTDADAVPDPDWLATGLGQLLAGADMVGGRIVPISSARPSLWEQYDESYLNQESFVHRHRFAATANFFARRSVIDAVGPFDPDLLSSGDKELCHRAAAAGFSLVYEPGAVVRHLPRTTFRETWKLHHRIGAGLAALERRQVELEIPAQVRAAPPPAPLAKRGVGGWVRRVRLLPAHITRVTARIVGRRSFRPG